MANCKHLCALPTPTLLGNEAILARTIRLFDGIQVDYREEKGTFNGRIPGEQAERRVRYIDREEIDPSLLSAMKQRSAVDSGKGVRIQVSTVRF